MVLINLMLFAGFLNLTTKTRKNAFILYEIRKNEKKKRKDFGIHIFY